MKNDNKFRVKDEKQPTLPNEDFEGEDKAPGEEQGMSELVTERDIKGKKNDGDPELESDQPVKQQ
ncbi:hypothetical protein [Pinibacter soli]|uniref:Uncharacterized protein n=1 Tax=Pinibacter soli TaxID=3044211 RepID=A0ABT6RFZ1_9BACT|nr:hypothetical protein [Pinibacter soli]MDI3320804.1 hypothetical protein [Pinibacter soli]